MKTMNKGRVVWGGFLVLLVMSGMTLRSYGQPRQPERSIPNLYSSLCAACHGAEMRGGQFKGFIGENWSGPSDDASLANAIRDGSTNKLMPAMSFALSDAEIRAMVVFIREKIQQAKNETNVFAKPIDGAVVNSREHKFKFKTVVTGLDTPWSMAFLPDGRQLIAELSGRLRVVVNGQLQPEPVSGTPKVRAKGQGGLMEVVLHPDYANNGWIYLGYSDAALDAGGKEVGMTAIARGRLKGNEWTDNEVIYCAPLETYLPTTHHYGNRLVFDGKGHLFFTIGERGSAEHAQNLKLPNGKVHRIFDDGRIPSDNPFVKQVGALPTIWCYGNRNPQGLAQHPETGEVWETEHGPRGGDELNLILPGRNYGWPIITFGMDYNGTPVTGGLTAKEGMEQPVTFWTPSIAVCGIDFYAGGKFPRWKNNLFVTGLASQEFRRLVLEGHAVKEQEVLFKNIGRVRDVANAPDGFVYVILNKPDQIVRLEPAE